VRAARYDVGSTQPRTDMRAMSVVVEPARRCGGSSKLRCHVGLCDDVLGGFAFLRAATRGNEHAKVVGHLSHKFAVANGVGPQALRACEIRQRRGLGSIRRVEVKGLVGSN
jgi:hypothetical protein